SGGGSFIVASENLGAGAGLAAAAALIVDYLLDVAVGIAAGVGALVSAVPRLQSHTVGLCLGILALLTLVNLRGVREAGAAFLLPTYLFVGCLLTVIGLGIVQTLMHGGHPVPVVAPPRAAAPLEAASAWLLLRAFASGCTALTGIEAVSNGVPMFRDPARPNARRTLAVIGVLLAVLLAGIAYLIRAYGVMATAPGAPGYRSVLAMLTAAVAGTGWFYYLTIAAILAVLALSANTAFAGFPLLCRMVAERGYLPGFFAMRGRRLVYTVGILVLAGLAAALLIAFGGITDRLIPLFAIGAFMAFTLSQAGMVVHWRRERGRGWRHKLAINGAGAIVTGITVGVVLVAKFAEGAWITALLIPGLIWLMLRVRRQYDLVEHQTAPAAFSLQRLQPPLAVVPIATWNRATENALRFAYMLSPDVHVVHIHCADDPKPAATEWHASLMAATAQAGLATPQLAVLESP
ncbi:MAG: APC family permease, partial [Terriglobales bacterium]